jgi:hypothetical protein
VGLASNNPVKIYHSHKNFNVPGNPAYNKHPTIKHKPNVGNKCNIPYNSITNLVR